MERIHKRSPMLVLEQTPTTTREALLTRLYEEAFPAAARYVRQREGSLDDARDIFQEALVRYYEKRTLEGFRPEISDKAYLLGMVKKLWLKQRERTPDIKRLENEDLTDEVESQPLTRKLLSFLQHTGAKCMDLLQSFYYEKLSMKELARKLEYSSERSATVQKYKCLEKMRNEVKQKSLQYEDFVS